MDTERQRATEDQVERRVRNQALFREVNNRILDVNDSFEDEGHVESFCECSDLACDVRVELSATEYRQLRADPTHFVTTPGHLEPTVDRVVFEGERYWIVETMPGEPCLKCGGTGVVDAPEPLREILRDVPFVCDRCSGSKTEPPPQPADTA